MQNETKANEAEKLSLPEPTLENPFAQVDFLFRRLAHIKSSSGGNILDCLSFYKRVYLGATNNYSPKLAHNKLFFVSEEWDSFALLKLQSFLDAYNTEGSPGRISSSSVVSYVTSFRQVLRYAALHKFTDGEYIHRVACAPVRAETTQNTAYSDSEMDRINNWLRDRLANIQKLLNVTGYRRTGRGSDPRIVAGFDNVRQKAYRSRAGWNNLDDLRWYFENEMNCQASCKPVHYSQRHYWFYRRASKYPEGYHQLLKDWQVRPVINLEIIMPLALKLSLETGLNPSSLWNLTADCFQEKHPLTGVSYLQYYKARSRGDMQMHINPYDKDLTIREFKEGQANVIRKTIALIREVTAPLREESPGNNLLFLFKNTGRNGKLETQVITWKVRYIDDQISSTWCLTSAVEDGLKADDGQQLQLTVGRFRSTKITDMVRRGIDFYEIQSHFGHKSILTTLRYVARNNIEIRARAETNKALETIHKNRVWQKEAQPEYAGTQSCSTSVVYKGILTNCRDVYDPPEEIRKAKDYQPAQACTRYNMCLFCKNVVLMRHHLPALVVYQRQIRQAAGYSTGELPNGHHYQRTLAVLDSILDPNKSEFSPEDLAWAVAAAECQDDFIDPVVYRPVI